MIPLIELEQLQKHKQVFIWGATWRTHRLARLCRLTAQTQIDAYIDTKQPAVLRQEAPALSFEEFQPLLLSAQTEEVALLCDGPLPHATQKEFEGTQVTLYDARFTLNVFFPPCVDDHQLSDVAFKRLWQIMLSRRGLAAAVRGQTERISYRSKITYDAVTRPAYAYSMLRAADEAKLLGINEISVVEFGVAGGNGLLAVEEHANAIEQMTGIKLHLFGFDGGKGLPAPTDYRDQPYLFVEGDYPMDEAALRARLTRTQLILGPVGETAQSFWQEHEAPPIGAVLFDVDYYSSTIDSFHLFTAPKARRMPRVTCYFDDLSWSPHVYENAGELQAIEDFNAAQKDLKIMRCINLDHMRILPAVWNQQIFTLHDFAHPLYNKPLRQSDFVDRLDLME